MKDLKIKLDPRSAVLEVLPKASIGIEVGVARGDFSKRILNTVKPQRLILVDPWHIAEEGSQKHAAHYGSDRVDQSFLDARYDSVLNRFKEQREKAIVEIFRGTFLEWSLEYPGISVDWVYVDGDHTFDAVSRDLDLAYQIVKPGGLIACDDYCKKGWWEDGVTEAVHKFLYERSSVVAEFVMGTQFVFRKEGER